ncbi:MAG TPA: zf-HC2 domain-containing protein [Ktedonobacteraceae bacterium]|nr:zf-HC2 domain-containing protein [Ktedonobacteraceae bacterium]
MTNANQKELSCQEVVELVTDYLEQALLPEKQAQFEEHIANCPGCNTFLEQVQQTIMMLRKLSEQQAFPETKQDLLEIFRNWKQGESKSDHPTA